MDLNEIAIDLALEWYDFDFFIFRLDTGFKTYDPSLEVSDRWFKNTLWEKQFLILELTTHFKLNVLFLKIFIKNGNTKRSYNWKKCVQKVYKLAKDKGFALPAVNVTGNNTINSVLETSSKLNSPVIIQLNGGSQFNAGKGLTNRSYHILGNSGAHHITNLPHGASEAYTIVLKIFTSIGLLMKMKILSETENLYLALIWLICQRTYWWKY